MTVESRVSRDSMPSMTLVLVCGPLAVGKTTIGQHLAALTGHRVLINHVTVPVADALFPRSDPTNRHHYVTLLKTLRIACVAAAAAAGVSVIVTLAYSGRTDDAFLAEMVAVAEAHGGVARFVQLAAPDEVLLARVGARSRRRWGKVTSKDRLRTVLATQDVRAPLPYPDVLRVDTSTMSATVAAHAIAEWLSDPPWVVSLINSMRKERSMPSPEFSLLLSASDCASLREALALDVAVKLAQGDTAGAEVLTALRERVDTAATVPVGDAVPTGMPHAGQAGAVYNTISGGSARDAVQCRDINGNIDLR